MKLDLSSIRTYLIRSIFSWATSQEHLTNIFFIHVSIEFQLNWNLCCRKCAPPEFILNLFFEKMRVAFAYWMHQIAWKMKKKKIMQTSPYIKWVNRKAKRCATNRNVNCIRLNIFGLSTLLCVDCCIFVTRKLLSKSMELEIHTAFMFSMFVEMNRFFFCLSILNHN